MEIPAVRHPVMYQQWRRLTFLHWRYPAELVQAGLPAGLTVETMDGTAWVGLIPFLMVGVRAPGVPEVPWLSRFPETNVRTYVRGTLAYRSRRRWPGPVGAYCDADVEVGGPMPTGPLDEFLTARFRLYSRFAGRLVTAEAGHPPWPLHRGRVTALDQNLVQAAGLPAPTEEPLVHTTPGVSVRIGRWHVAGT
ncbi:MAG: hypothetical protein AUI10_03405 [Actinobacteria bacterium 13_2_20CM_2_72_6]|nr:MAG: hypothetical protein AUI10_03405 [Actinobacteria bacterium 13_2_20CM_2_72_6]